MHAKVVVVAGPSGSGKSRLCRLRRDIVDWDDPRSWLADEAVDALERLCREGVAEVPVYELARDGRVGHRVLRLGEAPLLVAEGIFAQEMVAACAARGVLADAVCVRTHPVLTFWRRLARDLRERRKSPWVLVRRGLVLMRAQASVVARAESLGCEAMSPARAFTRVEALVRAEGSARR